MKLSQKINRRSFINQATSLVVGAGAFSASSSSYNRILGANDRISLGHIGVGRRGKELDSIVARLKEKNVEMTAVCDLWKINREAAAAQATKDYGKAPRVFQYMEALQGHIGWYRGEYNPEAFDIKEVVFGGKKRNPKKRKLQ